MHKYRNLEAYIKEGLISAENSAYRDNRCISKEYHEHTHQQDEYTAYIAFPYDPGITQVAMRIMYIRSRGQGVAAGSGIAINTARLRRFGNPLAITAVYSMYDNAPRFLNVEEFVERVVLFCGASFHAIGA
jgi:hypothetical protein